jgi:serine/threonine-protein kinase
VEVHLTVEDGSQAGQIFVIHPGQVYTAGTAADGSLSMGRRVTERHAQLRLEEGRLWLISLGDGFEESGSTTLLNADEVTAKGPVQVRPGDSVSIAGHQLRVDLVGGDPELARRELRTRRLGPESLPQDEFDVEGLIGKGSFGSVYSASRKSDGRRVAIKVFRDTVPGSVAFRRLDREAVTSAQVGGPHVVELLDARLDYEPPFLVMELVEGPSAYDLIQAGPLPIPQAIRIGQGVALALRDAHAKDVLHRDVKPANVLIGPDGEAKLADFGLAKDVGATVTALTATGQGLGSVAYMSPEQLRDSKRAGLQADVYCLGATLYHLVTGQPPFRPKTASELSKILFDEPVDPLELRADCPQPLRDLILAMLLKEPTDRPTIAHVAEALSQQRRALPG